MPFRVQLDAFHGPLDLLLYLVRKEELSIAELPLARLAEQYLEYVEVLEQLDVDAVGDFLDVASQLIELKSRRVLPQAEEESGEEVIESGEGLVKRLLEFRRYRRAAELLEERRTEWSQRRSRAAKPAPPREIDPADQPLEGVELWDLVSAFSRVVKRNATREAPPTTIFYDDTPVHIHMHRIDKRLRETAGPVPFAELFPDERVHKSTLVGVFVAVLELIRYRHALAEQPERYGEITLAPGPEPLPAGFGAPLSVAS